MANMDDLVREVAETKSVNDGVIAFIDGLKTQLDEAVRQVAQSGGSSAALDQAVADLDAQQQRISDAIRVNTVATPANPSPDNSVDALPNVEPPVAPLPDIVAPVEVTPPNAGGESPAAPVDAGPTPNPENTTSPDQATGNTSNTNPANPNATGDEGADDGSDENR